MVRIRTIAVEGDELLKVLLAGLRQAVPNLGLAEGEHIEEVESQWRVLDGQTLPSCCLTLRTNDTPIELDNDGTVSGSRKERLIAALQSENESLKAEVVELRRKHK